MVIYNCFCFIIFKVNINKHRKCGPHKEGTDQTKNKKNLGLGGGKKKVWIKEKICISIRENMWIIYRY